MQGPCGNVQGPSEEGEQGLYALRRLGLLGASLPGEDSESVDRQEVWAGSGGDERE